jgi:hypothetical protein
MENITNILKHIQSNNSIASYVLSKKHTIYKSKYNGIFSKNDFIKRIDENDSIYISKKDKLSNSLIVYIECDEFTDLNTFVMDLLKKITNKETNITASSSWIYTQTNEFNMKWMHTHEYLFPSNKTKIKTDWTAVFYVQLPNDLPKETEEGAIIFKTENKNTFMYTPEENDILIFKGDLEHMPNPTISSKTKRLVYSTNISFEVENEVNRTKPIRFKNMIYKLKSGNNQDTRI